MRCDVLKVAARVHNRSGERARLTCSRRGRATPRNGEDAKCGHGRSANSACHHEPGGRIHMNPCSHRYSHTKRDEKESGAYIAQRATGRDAYDRLIGEAALHQPALREGRAAVT